MKAKSGQKTWVQCTQCGKVYSISQRVPVSELYVESECPKCGYEDMALNCGDNEDDIYLYYDPYMDERYYKY